jgi:hypothetical protein
MKKEKVFDLLFKNCKDYLKLNHWVINFNFNREEDDSYNASLSDCDLTHFIAKITY